MIRTITNKGMITIDPVISCSLKNKLICQSNLKLGASSNFPTQAVIETQQLVLMTGIPSDCKMEQLALARAKALFGCECAITSTSFGEQVKQEILLSLIRRDDIIMWLDLKCDGKRFCRPLFTSPKTNLNIAHYNIDQNEPMVNINEILLIAIELGPKVIFVESSLYPRAIN